MEDFQDFQDILSFHVSKIFKAKKTNGYSEDAVERMCLVLVGGFECSLIFTALNNVIKLDSVKEKIVN